MPNSVFRCFFFTATVVVTALASTTANVMAQENGAAKQSTSDQPTIRLATYNIALYGKSKGEIAKRLEDGKDDQAERLAKVIHQVRPDILLINEIDFDDDAVTVRHFVEKFVNQTGATEPLVYPYVYAAPSNTGVDSGLDLNNDGDMHGPNDAWGYGVYPGQYAMAVISRYPIQRESIRTFQHFLWKDLPGAKIPKDPSSDRHHYDDAIWNVLRLSSKNHIDVPIEVSLTDSENLPGESAGQSHVIHLLASHPTPPVFDGPEDRNGCRNHDEVKFWEHYVSPESSGKLRDDNGQAGGLSITESFAIMGDLNTDPNSGDSQRDAIKNLIAHPRTLDPQPFRGADPSLVQTASWGSNRQLRIDYVLPSDNMNVADSGVFWPEQDDPGSKWITASDHRMVWIEVALP